MAEPAQQHDDDQIGRMTFEEAVELLESINDRIESGEIGLEQSLAEYERGMRLIRHCRSILDRAEARIAELTPDEDGADAQPEG